MPPRFKIVHSHGLTEPFVATYEEACERVRCVYTGAAIGHSGDIEDGGEQTMCWASAEDAANDPGVRSCCKIVKLHDPEVDA